jgi:hypothetical protein
MTDVTHLIGDLYIGSAPKSQNGYENFEVIVFCAEEYQPASFLFPKSKVRLFGFDDGELHERDLEIALNAASRTTADLIQRRKTLVTCRLGRNRSAFVCALAMHMLTGEPGKDTSNFVRQKRSDMVGVKALSNQHFRAYLDTL